MTNVISIWSAEEPLILASKSTVRAELLKKVGFIFSIQSADIDERTIENKLDLSEKHHEKLHLCWLRQKLLPLATITLTLG